MPKHKKNAVTFDATVRLIGSFCLIIGVLFGTPGLINRTLSTLFVWLSLLIGFISLIFSFFGKRSWYVGILISGAAYFYMLAQFSSSQILKIIVTVIVLVVGLGGFLGGFAKRTFGSSLFITDKK